jgi:hypothetical protein
VPGILTRSPPKFAFFVSEFGSMFFLSNTTIQ